jgi:hypothetical protein
MNRTYWLRTSENPLTDQDEDTLIVIGKKGTYFFNYKTQGWHFVDSKPKSAELLNRPNCVMEEATRGFSEGHSVFGKSKLGKVSFLDDWFPVKIVDWVVNKCLSKPINVDPAQITGGGYINE